MTRLAGTNFGYMWTETLDEGFGKLADMGVDHAELTVSLPHVDLRIPTEELAQGINAAAKAHGITFTSLNPVELNLISPNGSLADTAQEQLMKTVDLAEAVGAPIVVVVPGRYNSLCPMDQQVALDAFHRRLEQLLKHAIKRNVSLGLENAPFGFLQTPTHLLAQVTMFAHENLGLTVDAANLHYTGDDMRAEVENVRKKILLAHISDTTRARFAHAHMGDGDVDFPGFARALQDVGYTGDTVYELVTPGVDWERWRRDFDRMRALGWR